MIGILLSLVGVVIVARRQIFIGMAVAQGSTLGIALGLWATAFFHLEGLGENDLFLSSLGVMGAILTTVVTSRKGFEKGSVHEERTGIVFLFASSASLILLSKSPFGLEEVHRLLTSTVIGATATDVMVTALLTVVTIITVILNFPAVRLLAMDPVFAVAIGMRSGKSSVIAMGWLGLTLGLSIRLSGVLYAFGCLILPCLAAKQMCRTTTSLFWVSPLIFLLTSLPALVLSHAFDLPPGQGTVLALCLVTLVFGLKKGQFS